MTPQEALKLADILQARFLNVKVEAATEPIAVFARDHTRIPKLQFCSHLVCRLRDVTATIKGNYMASGPHPREWKLIEYCDDCGLVFKQEIQERVA